MFNSVAGSTGAGGIISCSLLARKTNGIGGGASEINLFLAADLVAILPPDESLRAGVGTLELLVRGPDIALLVCKVIFGLEK